MRRRNSSNMQMLKAAAGILAVAMLTAACSTGTLSSSSTTSTTRVETRSASTVPSPTTIPPTNTTIPPTTTTTAYPATGPVPACTGGNSLPVFQIPLANGVPSTYFWETPASPGALGSACFTLTAASAASFPEAYPCSFALGFIKIGPFTFYNGKTIYVGLNNGQYCYVYG